MSLKMTNRTFKTMNQDHGVVTSMFCGLNVQQILKMYHNSLVNSIK